MISTSEFAHTLDVMEKLALQAGAAILDIRGRGWTATEKADGSPVTEADQRGEAVIVEGLQALLPGVPIVAEEMVSAGVVPRALGRQFILVDALDGTKEFCAGRDEFTVNIALVEDGRPVIGVVHAPALGKLYSGYSGSNGIRSASLSITGAEGESMRRDEIRVRPAASVPTIVATRSHMNPQTKAYLDQFPGADTRSIGSSLKFCLLAAGEADLYPRFGTTMEWDTAAGDAVLRAANGVTACEDGKALNYGKRNQIGMADFQNPYFICRGG